MVIYKVLDYKKLKVIVSKKIVIVQPPLSLNIMETLKEGKNKGVVNINGVKIMNIMEAFRKVS